MRLEEIVAEADGVMVARGDLGVEIDVAQMPIEQKRIIRVCQELQKPSIIATQMLDSMHESPRPTRAEATDVANAILDGADACMLSGETAIGKFPREAVEMMNRIALATEESMAGRPPREMTRPRADNLQEITRAVVRGAGTMAHSLGGEARRRREPLGPDGARPVAAAELRADDRRQHQRNDAAEDVSLLGRDAAARGAGDECGTAHPPRRRLGLRGGTRREGRPAGHRRRFAPGGRSRRRRDVDGRA